MKVKSIGSTTAQAKEFIQKLQQREINLSKSSEVEIVTVNFSESLSSDDKKAISYTLAKENSILFFDNVKKEDFPENALITADSDFCVIKGQLHGRHQHVLISGSKEQPNLVLDARKNEVTTIEATDETQKQKSSEKKSSEENSNEPVNVSSKIEGPNIFNWLDSLSDETYEDFQLVNASLMRGSVTIETLYYTSDMNGKKTNASTYASYNVELSAVVDPKRNKILKITSVASYVSITDGMSINTDDYKGDGTFEGRMIFYPGYKYTFDKSEVKLPDGWRIIKIAPETLNSDNTYVRTTGWTIGAEGGGTISKDPNVAAKLSASYSESEAYSQTFKDFTAINQSSSVYCDWSYLYTKVHLDWESIFSTWMKDIENFPELAKSTMYMKNEVVYEAPESDNSNLRFNSYIHHETLYAHSHGSWGIIKYGIDYKIPAYNWNCFYVNMNQVIFPQSN